MIVLVAAEKREFQGLWRHVQKRRKMNWPLPVAMCAELGGQTVAMVANGPGPTLARRAVDVVREQVEVNGMVSTGFCGALDPTLERGAIFIAGEVEDGGGSLYPAARVTQRTSGVRACTGKVLSIDRVAVTPEEKRQLRRSGAGVVEMEAAAVAERARAFDVPFYCVRVVTDTAQEGFSIDFNRMRNGEGRFSRSAIIKAACRNPWKLFPELMQFDQRSKAAALKLGEFLADCQF